MRYLILSFLFFLTSISVFAQHSPDQSRCSESKEETILFLQSFNISGLRLKLYALSQFQPENPEDVINLQKIANAAVFSLANEFSAQSDRFQRCSLSDKEYYQKTRLVNNLSLILLETVGFEIWWSAMTDRWPLENTPPLVGHLAPNQAILGKRLPMHPVIENTLRAYAREWQQIDNTDPVQIAALELLGQEPNWDIKRFVLINFFQLYQGIGPSDEFYGESLEEFRKKPISERLAIVADRYFRQ